MRAEVCTEVRRQELTDPSAAEPGRIDPVRRAAEGVLHVYQHLAVARAHLLDELLAGTPPEAWAHYPEDDARDHARGYQWFYHSHSAEDRPGAAEHGHFHVFARRPALDRWLVANDETSWRQGLGFSRSSAKTRHLFCIGLDAKGVPNTLFTVNSWVTGDAMASAEGTLRLIAGLDLDTGHAGIDRLISSLAKLCAPQFARLMRDRDQALVKRSAVGPGTLEDQELEVLSEARLDLDLMFTRIFSDSQ